MYILYENTGLQNNNNDSRELMILDSDKLLEIFKKYRPAHLERFTLIPSFGRCNRHENLFIGSS